VNPFPVISIVIFIAPANAFESPMPVIDLS